MPRVERADEPWTRDVLVLWPKEDHMIRVNKKDEEWRSKEEHMIRVNKRDEEWRPKEDHMMRVNKKDDDTRRLASRIGK